MTRQIRVKVINQSAIIAELTRQGFTASPCDTPLGDADAGCGWNLLDYGDQTKAIEQSLHGMAGISTSASGKQAHRIIKDLKDKGFCV